MTAQIVTVYPSGYCNGDTVVLRIEKPEDVYRIVWERCGRSALIAYQTPDNRFGPHRPITEAQMRAFSRHDNS
jgi:hypothetical protein